MGGGGSLVTLSKTNFGLAVSHKVAQGKKRKNKSTVTVRGARLKFVTLSRVIS